MSTTRPAISFTRRTSTASPSYFNTISWQLPDWPDRSQVCILFADDAQGRCTHSKGEDGLFEINSNTTWKPTPSTTCGLPFTYFYNDAGAVTQITDPYGAATDSPPRRAGLRRRDHSTATSRRSSTIATANSRFVPIPMDASCQSGTPSPHPYAYHLPESPLEWELATGSAANFTTRADDSGSRVSFPRRLSTVTLGKSETTNSAFSSTKRCRTTALPTTLGAPA